MWFTGCVHVFLRESNTEFPVELWDVRVRVIVGVVNCLLLVMVIVLLVTYFDAICICLQLY